jgi:hypothetical protein
MTFRFDDVSRNTDQKTLCGITNLLLDRGYNIIWGVSVLTHASEKLTGRVFPESIKALSDFKEFYNVDRCELIETVLDVDFASHGLVHVDHRLLTKEAQEMSILISCSLTKSQMFIPPFNKWNSDTEEVCRENDITLIKYEDGWKSCEHNKFNDEDFQNWYLHPQLWTIQKFKQWLR